MRVKFYFSGTKNLVPINNQKELNSYIHTCLGKDNVYHDIFSNYAISSLQGGKLVDNKFLDYSNGSYFYISGDVLGEDTTPLDVITKLMDGVVINPELGWGMKFLRFEVGDYKVGEYCDKIQTISPILLKAKVDERKHRSITFQDVNFIEVLTKKCKMKLKYTNMFSDDEIDTLDIKLNKVVNAKVKIVHVGDIFNICSQVRLVVYGNKKIRKTLYSMGLGNSTGSGFGVIEIFN